MFTTTVDPATRSIAASIDVPGTPDVVWEAIATATGLSGWLLPTTLDGREGGAIVLQTGPEMGESRGVVTVWDPPRHFAYEEREWYCAGAPALLNDFTITPRADGTCTFDVINRLVTASAEWDDELRTFEVHWNTFFLPMLKLYLTFFPGQPGVTLQLTGGAGGSPEEIFHRLITALGFQDAQPGALAKGAIASGLPPLEGLVESRTPDAMLIRMTEPSAGFMWMRAEGTSLEFTFFFCGEGAEAAAAEAHPIWQAWITRHFPAGEDIQGHQSSST